MDWGTKGRCIGSNIIMLDLRGVLCLRDTLGKITVNFEELASYKNEPSARFVYHKMATKVSKAAGLELSKLYLYKPK